MVHELCALANKNRSVLRVRGSWVARNCSAPAKLVFVIHVVTFALNAVCGSDGTQFYLWQHFYFLVFSIHLIQVFRCFNATRERRNKNALCIIIIIFYSCFEWLYKFICVSQAAEKKNEMRKNGAMKEMRDNQLRIRFFFMWLRSMNNGTSPVITDSCYF